MSKLYGPKFIWTVQRECYRVKRSKARAFITHGPVVEAIIKAAERENTDLMAFASHGRNGLYKGILWKCGGRCSASYRPASAAYLIGLTDEEIDIIVTETNAANF